MNIEFISNNAGLILNFIGTLVTAFSIGKFPKEFAASSTGNDGKEYHIAYVLHPFGVHVGFTLIATGFLLQMLTQ